MNRSTPGLPVHHQLPEFTQTHAHRVSDAIQPSHPLSSPSPPAPNPSQHQGLFQWVNSSYEVAKVLEFQLQHQSFQWTPRISFRMDRLDLLAVWSCDSTSLVTLERTGPHAWGSAVSVSSQPPATPPPRLWKSDPKVCCFPKDWGMWWRKRWETNN